MSVAVERAETEEEHGKAPTMRPGEGEDHLVGQLLAERYRVEKKLGEGGMGRVYLAVHEGIGKRVAIKCLNADLATHGTVVERFKREARAATSIGHEHIIDVTDMGTLEDGAPFLVMELLDGKELGDVLDEEGPLPIGRAVRILTQACAALDAAHEKGIVHRDLKPENIFLVKRTRTADFVKVLDFGISKFTERAIGAPAALTATGMTMGTPLYMSPEQAQGLKSMDHRTDVYALGVILFQLLTGNAPYEAETFPMLVVQIVAGDVPSTRVRRPDVPEALDAAVMRCLAKDPDDRFASCAELAEALHPFAAMDAAPEVVEPAATMAARPAVKTPSPTAVTAAATPSGVVASEAGSVAGAPAGASTSPATEVPKQAPGEEARRARWPIVAGVLLGLAGVGGWAVAAGLEDEPEAEVTTTTETEVEATEVEATTEPATVDATREPTVEAPVEAAPTEVAVSILVTPPAARIFVDDVEYPNPLRASLTRTLTPVRLRIEGEGYEPHEELVVLDRPVERLISLTPEERSSTSMMRALPREPTREAEPETMEAATTMDDGFRDDW